jgi:hypothetical protein
MNTMAEIADRAITGSDLRELIEQHRVLMGDYVPPSASALTSLATAVSVLRGRCRQGKRVSWTPEMHARDQLRRRASQALATLIEVLPELEADSATQALEESDPLFRQMLLKDTEEIAAFRRVVEDTWERGWVIPFHEASIAVSVGAEWAIQHSEAWGVPAPTPVQETHTWHHFAAWLAERFRDVVQASNPSLPRLKNANGGPVAKFLAAMVPYITGERPSLDAVRAYLRRDRQGDNRLG